MFCLTTVKAIPAHELTPAIAEITLQQQPGEASFSAQANIKLNLESLMAEIGAGHDDTDDSPNSERYKALRKLSADELAAGSQQFQQVFTESIFIQSDTGRRVTVDNASLVINTQDDIDLARDSLLIVDFKFESDETGFTWQWPARFGEIIVRTASRSEDLDYAALLSAGQRSETIQLGAITQIPATTTFSNYLVIGFQHIIPKGLDHILFVIGIFLLSPYWKPLFIQATTFTIAHSITLALTILGYISFPSTIVEPLIALSIVYVCIENLFLEQVQKTRIMLVFLFGLLHGMGFASVLSEVGLQSQHFVLALLSFNIGVELGQLTILAMCLLLLGLQFREKKWYKKRISRPCSIVIGLIGGFWLLQRTVPLLQNIL